MNINKLYLGVAYDAMRVLGFKSEQFYIDIKPKVYDGNTIAGQAFTTHGEVVSDDADYATLDNIRLKMYGDFNRIHGTYNVDKLQPLVLLESNDKKVAHSGDITSAIYQKLGAIGFITDGIVRDIDKIKKIKFPTFCNGVNPIDALDYWALTEYNTPIKIQGVVITPGDAIIAGGDGIIRVPLFIWREFKKECAKILKKEDAARSFIEAHDISSVNIGKDFINLVKTIGRW